jgi:ribosomal protein L29
MSKGFCDVAGAIHAEGEATRALINATTMQELRDKLADRDRELMTANFQLSQQAQNAYLINEIRPCAKPAYITCSPYTTASFGGCGTGYGV